MRAVRGFGKNYFTLAAIQATSGAATLHRRRCALFSTASALYLRPCEKEEDPPPEEVPLCTCGDAGERDRSRPCHCNRFFRRLAWLLLHLSELHKRPPCRCRYTKTGLAPPPFE
jgi:hypothetical protein